MSPEHIDDDVHTASARSIRDDDDAIGRGNFITNTNSPRFACSTTTVQACPATLVEEGIRELAPSSFEICFPVVTVNIAFHVEADSVAEQAIIQRCPQSKYLDFLIVQIQVSRAEN